MLHESSPEITQIDQDVLELSFKKLILAPMKSPTAKLSLNAQVWKEHDQA